MGPVEWKELRHSGAGAEARREGTVKGCPRVPGLDRRPMTSAAQTALAKLELYFMRAGYFLIRTYACISTICMNYYNYLGFAPRRELNSVAAECSF